VVLAAGQPCNPKWPLRRAISFADGVKVAEGWKELIIVVDDAVGAQFGDGALRVAEADGYDWNVCCFGGADVDIAIADHQGTGGIAAGEADGAE
jgi:hypothetical protein